MLFSTAFFLYLLIGEKGGGQSFFLIKKLGFIFAKSSEEMLVYRGFLLFTDMNSSDMFCIVPISSVLVLTFASFFFYQMKY